MLSVLGQVQSIVEVSLRRAVRVLLAARVEVETEVLVSSSDSLDVASKITDGRLSAALAAKGLPGVRLKAPPVVLDGDSTPAVARPSPVQSDTVPTPTVGPDQQADAGGGSSSSLAIGMAVVALATLVAAIFLVRLLLFRSPDCVSMMGQPAAPS